MIAPPPWQLAAWPEPNYVDPVTRGDAKIILNLVLYPIVLMLILLRVYTRVFHLKVNTFSIDDTMILLAMVHITTLHSKKKRLKDHTDSNDSLLRIQPPRRFTLPLETTRLRHSTLQHRNRTKTSPRSRIHVCSRLHPHQTIHALPNPTSPRNSNPILAANNTRSNLDCSHPRHSIRIRNNISMSTAPGLLESGISYSTRMY